MNILITGCNGQLGREMQRLQAAHPEHKWVNTDVAELDITNKAAIERLVEEREIEGIVNCAAYTAVDKAESDKELCRMLNAVAPAYLAEAVEKRGGWMIQVSTDYVFDGTKHTPYLETDTPVPTGVYGSTKLEGEIAVSKECRKAMIIRTAWLYSVHGNNFVKTMMRLGKEKERLGVIFDQIGTPTAARDLAEVIMTAIDKGVVPGVFHFSNEGVISWYDFTKAIHRIAGITGCHVLPIHTAEYPTPAKRPAYSVLDKTKIKQTYGIEVPYWEESLKTCIGELSEG
ncbi:MAG: dTDP-4-dehydrorhamnose reductase [Prevotella sp.]|uniref:dTDP-4-dehydrorhamnose reductase n=1 Tax=Prevotella sp. TaxID=59823 RepID=UPI002A35541B|nr:dTDP-4-dehydrorhamnose reductase [Prevotella sp.]MDD7317544.1 dTDP-4-dehydrorhamnose reductase [Prevotellaceae bacterium]MDY4020609.1 dTDP-4-dehydrorhamnose reductase [Prevotella sp.]